ncbi:MAG: DUF6049 family protein [Nocardioides sp.]
MLRRLSLLPALVAVATTLAVHAPARAATPERYHAPLTVTIDSLSPSYVPRTGRVRVSGTVTNTDDVAWHDVRVYSFISSDPMTSADELDEATSVDPTADVGGRVTDPGTFDTLSYLAPGSTTHFSLSVPHRLLDATAPGVYWFGVHALGATDQGRVDGADGRARTFLPSVPRDATPVPTALVGQLRHGITHASDGSLEDLDGWTTTLGVGGQLRSLVDFGATAGTHPITWLVDPALTDTARALAAGNPARSLAPTPAPGEPSASPSPSPTTSAEASSGDGDDTGTVTRAQREAAAIVSRAFLSRMHAALRNAQLLALPYGDLDVSAAAVRDPDLYARARARSGTTLAPWGLHMTPAVGSPSGYLSPAGIRMVDPGDTILLADRAIGGDAPAVAHTAGHRLVTTSVAAASGGPGPGDRLDPLAERQRILSEAALRTLGHTPAPTPLVVLLPHDWQPLDTRGFFKGLDAPWLDLTTLTGASSVPTTGVRLDRLRYPQRQARRELTPQSFTAADALIDAGRTLQSVLSQNEDVARTVADEALAGTSYSARLHPDTSLAAADRARAVIDDQLASITVDAPSAVTLSSASGKFAATITNGLDQPVRVHVNAMVDQPMEVEGPRVVDIGPHGHNTVLLTARTDQAGVHNVTLVVTDVEGRPLGSTVQLPIRSVQVSNVIWVILGSGVLLLFGAIAVRLVRRVRAAARAARAA